MFEQGSLERSCELMRILQRRISTEGKILAFRFRRGTQEKVERLGASLLELDAWSASSWRCSGKEGSAVIIGKLGGMDHEST